MINKGHNFNISYVHPAATMPLPQKEIDWKAYHTHHKMPGLPNPPVLLWAQTPSPIIPSRPIRYCHNDPAVVHWSQSWLYNCHSIAFRPVWGPHGPTIWAFWGVTCMQRTLRTLLWERLPRLMDNNAPPVYASCHALSLTRKVLFLFDFSTFYIASKNKMRTLSFLGLWGLISVRIKMVPSMKIEIAALDFG